MNPVSRVGDSTNHMGAPIISGSSNVLVNFMPCARLNDEVSTHIMIVEPHLVNTITSGNNYTLVNFLPVAHINSSVSCGATVVSGSSDTLT